MPTYEYKCEYCGEVFEEYVTLSKRNDEQECHFCHRITAHRTEKLYPRPFKFGPIEDNN